MSVSRFSKITSFLWREPLVHFILAATVLITLHHFLVRPAIEVSPQLANGLRKEYETRWSRKATDADMARLVRDYIEDEVLFREALKTGLVNDNRVRALLVATMRSSLRPILNAPTDADLEKLRAETPDTYRFPAQVGFEHVSFSDEKSIPAGLLEKLRAGAPTAGLGEAVHLANPLPPTFRPQLERIFGPDFVKALLQCKKDVWNGPIKSERGIHFIRITTQDAPNDIPLDEIRTTLASQWNTVKENAAIADKARELRKSYRVVLPPNIPAQP